MSKKLLAVALGVAIAFSMGFGTTTVYAGDCSLGNLGACSTNLILQDIAVCDSAKTCVTWFINVVFLFAVLATFVNLVWGGIDYILSGGGDAAKKGRDKITAAVIGLIIVILAWAIMNFVISIFVQGKTTENFIPVSESGTSFNWAQQRNVAQ